MLLCGATPPRSGSVARSAACIFSLSLVCRERDISPRSVFFILLCGARVCAAGCTVVQCGSWGLHSTTRSLQFHLVWVGQHLHNVVIHWMVFYVQRRGRVPSDHVRIRPLKFGIAGRLRPSVRMSVMRSTPFHDTTTICGGRSVAGRCAPQWHSGRERTVACCSGAEQVQAGRSRLHRASALVAARLGMSAYFAVLAAVGPRRYGFGG